ncbi:hypothetical protein QE152_g11353 [Popillia japonica]|uniref:Uncharacterized protein n=1 Tax=Popillia japonica TaxID=7064 RepID=A0AAW1LRT3_POPJA
MKVIQILYLNFRNMDNGDHKHLNHHLSSLLNHLDNYKIASKQSQHLWKEQQEEYYTTEETQWIEETQQEFEEDNYEHERKTTTNMRITPASWSNQR